MITARKPIIMRFDGLPSFATGTFTVQLYSHREQAFVDVYTGRFITDKDGVVEISIDDICRDYAYNYPLKWQSSLQGYVPAALDVPAAKHLPNDNIFTLVAVVLTIDLKNMVRTSLFWTGWLPIWQQSAELVYQSGQVANLTFLGNNMVPRVPPVATTYMWLELVMQWFESAQPEIGTPEHRMAIRTDGEGCYDVAYTLQDIFTELYNSEVDGGVSSSTYGRVVDGGDSESVMEDELDGGTSNNEYTIAANVDLFLYHNDTPIPLAHIDMCPSPFYVAWILPSGGWMCWGFDGNVTVSASPDVTTIRNVRNTDRITSMDVQQIFNLYTGFLTREEYNVLTTLAYTHEVYIYDVKNDRGTWCSVESRTLPTAGSVRWRNEPLNITAKEIVHKEL